MKTLYDIYNITLQQKLNEICSCDTQEQNDALSVFTAPNEIMRRINEVLLWTITKEYSFFYITFNSTENIFTLEADVFINVNTTAGEWVRTHNPHIEWTQIWNGSYMLSYKSGSKVGEVMSKLIPVIYKTS